MPNAEKFVADTRRALAPVAERLAAHPYLAALDEGRVARERLRIFAGEQHRIITSDLRSIAVLVNRHGHLPSRDHFLGSLQGEATALEALRAFAAALDMTEADLFEYEPMPGCQAYPAYVSWLALYGSDAAFAAAFLANLPEWGAACGRMRDALKARYALEDEAVAFFDFFASSPPEFESDSLRVIQDGLERGVDPRELARAARLIQAYELMYWDTIYEASV